MNVLMDDLPCTIIVADIEIPIDTDYRTGILFVFWYTKVVTAGSDNVIIKMNKGGTSNMAKVYNEEFKKQLVKEYIQGKSYLTLEKEYGVAKSTLSG